ncbi:hypothetical protein [Microcoleus sp. CAWBG58]|uniref:hypothetical protein n=1 Tax=Microcoleus sp. CAWBG58 TaxID=2841651 RepID=UPI0025CE2F67|nr:hypothetical protein [Microcoleus sp. CAWBG58]
MNAQYHREEVRQVLDELHKSVEIDGFFLPDMFVSGIYPNVRVFARAFMLLMLVEDRTGSGMRFPVIGDDDPRGDSGGVNNDTGNRLPDRDNNTGLEF